MNYLGFIDIARSYKTRKLAGGMAFRNSFITLKLLELFPTEAIDVALCTFVGKVIPS